MQIFVLICGLELVVKQKKNNFMTLCMYHYAASIVIPCVLFSFSSLQDQYAFCHTVLADYIDKFDNYANFKDMI